MYALTVSPDGGLQITADIPLNKVELEDATETIGKLLELQQQNRIVDLAYDELEPPDED